ncbi:MAG: hypothetical protein E7101_11300 [Prevotella ruminicola]|uniref:MetA-pathway of phenol degradation n=1 Tax=Xylanibacter ruminicola TaxID=839 RepID=A0A9D5SAZ6_XYLRU|nr:hypothetical protein [Xylanibacter ruminicola]
MKKCIFLAFACLLGATATHAQDEVETTVETDVVSQYVWRGLDLGQTSLQPTLGISYKGLSLSAWSSVGLTNANDPREIDLTLGYTISGLNISITDYWVTGGLDPENRYLRYNAHSTNHVFEANIGYDFGPLSLQWYTNFAGNDGLTRKDKRAYSSYVEANVPFKLGGCNWLATLGAVPFNTDYYDADGFIINNVSLRADRDIKITDSFSIPVFGQVSVNPSSEHAYFVFGFKLKAF